MSEVVSLLLDSLLLLLVVLFLLVACTPLVVAWLIRKSLKDQLAECVERDRRKTPGGAA